MPRALLLLFVLAACQDTQVNGVLDIGGLKLTVYPNISITLGQDP